MVSSNSAGVATLRASRPPSRAPTQVQVWPHRVCITRSRTPLLLLLLQDAQSWPLESPSWPSLWLDAFSSLERYTTDDVAGVVEYARARGIRTVFEVDHPGHLSSACKGYAELCPADCVWDAGDNSVPLAPASNATWKMLADTLGELAALSPDAFLHLGGDEVSYFISNISCARRASDILLVCATLATRGCGHAPCM